jgi:hypothetical protein
MKLHVLVLAYCISWQLFVKELLLMSIYQISMDYTSFYKKCKFYLNYSNECKASEYDLVFCYQKQFIIVVDQK